MKKILCLILMLIAPVFALNIIDEKEHKNFLNSLRLSKKQEKKIDEIEKNFKKKNVELNSEIILKETHLATLRHRADSALLSKELKKEIQYLEGAKCRLYEDMYNDTADVLNFFQARKYKNFLSKTK